MKTLVEWMRVRTSVVTWAIIAIMAAGVGGIVTVISGWQSTSNSVPDIRRDIERLYNADTTANVQIKRLEKLYDMQNQRLMQQEGRITIMDTVNRMQFRLVLQELKEIKEDINEKR